MSMTEQGLTFCVRTPSLAEAVARFNELFGYTLLLPALPEDIENAAELAALRGRQDIADDIRTALKQSL